jgi:multidrug efflux pump
VEAALVSARQLFAPLVGMTITLAAVYAPIGFLSGLTGVLFKEFAFTLAMAVIMSGIVADPVARDERRLVREPGGAARAFVERASRRPELYARALDATLAAQPRGSARDGVLLPLFLFSPRELAPAGPGRDRLYVESAPDASVRYTADWTSEVIRRLVLPEHLSWEISLASRPSANVLKDYASGSERDGDDSTVYGTDRGAGARVRLLSPPSRRELRRGLVVSSVTARAHGAGAQSSCRRRSTRSASCSPTPISR